ncbi:secretin N-terminal domain-containing protein [Vibrio tritonius]|uniref:secretin N-terminal domain-containing protein n=1 Tax=Vibrio tritonius TaxID=1435069 RepID=UPI000838F1FD|nr:secretin N-terminal domain-containing protein [Vibrio tritonius]
MKSLIAKTLLAALLVPCCITPALAIEAKSPFEQQQVFEANDTPIGDFVAWYAKQTGLKVLLAQGVTGTVSFTAPHLLPAEYPAFFESVLRSHGYLIEKDGDSYVVRVNADAYNTIKPSDVRLYHLNYVRNTKVVDLISSALKATNTQMVKDKKLDNYMVQVLPSTNAIIVSGTPEQLEKIELILSGIDKPQRQVYIEAAITETEMRGSDELGINLTGALGDAGFSTATTSSNRVTDNLFIFQGGNFSSLIKAVTTNKNTKLLSTPNILIMDRERGYITVGQNVPFLVSKEITDGGNTVQSIERKDVGVSLSVTPHVLGDMVVLQITQEPSSVSDSTLAADIITNTRTLSTVVVVKDGETIVLGGLISHETKTTESGVPLLKDIPVLGNVFKSTSKEDAQKDLKVIIKTTLL